MMLGRTCAGCQWRSWSSDGGVTWSEGEPTDILSPLSPAAVKRIPHTGDLLMVWNDYRHVPEELRDLRRTPLAAGISRDEGRSWESSKVIEGDLEGRYAYPAIHFHEDRVLLGYGAGDSWGSGLRVAHFPLSWLYE